MAEEVDININIDPNGSVRKQIKETQQAMQKLELQGKATGETYQKLRENYDKLNDTLDRSKFKAGQFEDKMAALPGPLGKVGSGMKAAGDAVATFGLKLTVALGFVGLLVTAFFAIKSALEKTKEGQQGLSKAVEAFNKVLSPVFAILEKVGNAVLPLVTKGFEALGSVMNKVAKFFGVTDSKIKEVQGTLQQDNEYKKKLDDEETKRLADLQKKKDDQAQKDKERRAKSLADKEAAEKEAFEKEKRDLEYQLTEMERIRAKFKKIGLEPIGSDGLTKTEREKDQKDKEDRTKYFKEKEEKLLKESNEKGLGKFLADKAIIIAKDIKADEDALAAKRNIAELEVQNKQDTAFAIADITAGLSNIIGQDTAAGKAIAVASATIDTYLAASTIFKQAAKNPITTINPAYPYLMAAPAVLAGIARVKQITAVKIPNARGGSSAGAGVAPPSFSSIPSMAAPQVQTGQGINATTQIAQTIGAAQKPIEAYVLSTKVSSMQALDRRTNSAATFS
jgi:hypothetical protein